jgi:hypothetical protein
MKFSLIIAGLLLVSMVSACTPTYDCADWGECTDGIQIRKCAEMSCGLAPLIERKLCGENKNECKVKYSCTTWSSCTYLDKTNDILNNNINFKGYQERACIDENECVEGFAEQKSCEDIYKVKFVQIEQCGTPFLLALDAGSSKEVSQINLDSWRSQRLDIAFIQSNFSYCPSCYNGFRDQNEEGIDCGGDCKSCTTEQGISEQAFFIGSSWVTSALIFFAFIFSTFFNNRTRMRYLIYQAYKAVDRKDKVKLKVIISKIRRMQKDLSDDQKEYFRKDLDRLYRRI